MTPSKSRLRILQAGWELQHLWPEEVPDLAAALLAEGIDSEALAVLASLSQPTLWEVEPLIRRVFVETGLPPLGKDEACWLLARQTAEDILSGTTAPRRGAAVISGICRDLGMPDSLTYWIYLDADYGVGPGESEWFDEQIREQAAQLIALVCGESRGNDA